MSACKVCGTEKIIRTTTKGLDYTACPKCKPAGAPTRQMVNPDDVAPGNKTAAKKVAAKTAPPAKARTLAERLRERSGFRIRSSKQ